MRILSIRQPWAYLIANGDKDIENRSWRTKYRGLFLIHASLALDRDGCRAQKLLAEDMETGGVVGMAEIVDCVTYHPSKWFRGHYGFVLRKRRSLPFVKWSGMLGLREAPPRLVRRLGL